MKPWTAGDRRGHVQGKAAAARGGQSGQPCGGGNRWRRVTRGEGAPRELRAWPATWAAMLFGNAWECGPERGHGLPNGAAWWSAKEPASRPRSGRVKRRRTRRSGRREWPTGGRLSWGQPIRRCKRPRKPAIEPAVAPAKRHIATKAQCWGLSALAPAEWSKAGAGWRNQIRDMAGTLNGPWSCRRQHRGSKRPG